MLKICYYDNIICEQNPEHIVYPFVRTLLDWVENTNSHLTIKTKWRKSFRPLKHGKYWYFWRKKLEEKNVYKYYPQDIKDRIKALQEANKLEIIRDLGNIQPGLEADLVIVMPSGEVATELSNFRQVFLFEHPESYSAKRIKRFSTKEEMIEIFENLCLRKVQGL